MMLVSSTVHVCRNCVFENCLIIFSGCNVLSVNCDKCPCFEYCMLPMHRYVTWNVHEPQPGIFDFSAQQNLSHFLQLAQDTGLLVILRAGPYICGNWDYVSLHPKSFCFFFVSYNFFIWWSITAVVMSGPLSLVSCNEYQQKVGCTQVCGTMH